VTRVGRGLRNKTKNRGVVTRPNGSFEGAVTRPKNITGTGIRPKIITGTGIRPKKTVIRPKNQ
jgi:hypothetical protein